MYEVWEGVRWVLGLGAEPSYANFFTDGITRNHHVCGGADDGALSRRSQNEITMKFV